MQNEAELPIYRHKKRGSLYEVIGIATLQGSSETKEGDTLTVYGSSDSGDLWARSDGDTYLGQFVGSASLQTSVFLTEGAKLVIYRSLDDQKIWARESSEFHDGRFEPGFAVRSRFANAPLPLTLPPGYFRDPVFKKSDQGT